MSPVLNDRKLSIQLKVRLLKCFIWSVLLYGCESWTLSAALTRNIEATEMWFYRRMLRVSYTAHETNISVLQRMGQERQLLRTIKERQTRFTGHIIRKGQLEDLILAGKVQGKKARGGQRLLFLNQVMENTKVGGQTHTSERATGCFGLGQRNERGDTLVEWATSNCHNTRQHWK